MSNFLHRSEKLGILNDLKYFQSSNDNDEEIILAAFEHAKQLLGKLGVLSVLRKK